MQKRLKEVIASFWLKGFYISFEKTDKTSKNQLDSSNL